MAVTVVTASATQAEASSATQITISVPSGTVNGDVLFLALGATSGTPASIPGWTFIASASSTGETPAAFFRVASSEPASYTITGINGGTAGRITVQMARLTGVDTTTTMDVAAAGTTGTAAATFNPPRVTTVTAGALMMYVGELNAATAADLTIDAGATTLLDSTGVGKRTLTGFATQTTAGLSDLRTFTESGTTINWGALTIAFRPAATSSPSYSGSLALSGSGSLAPSGTAQVSASLPLSGAGSLSLSGRGAASGSLSLSGSGALALSGSSGSVAFDGSLALSGAGSLSLSGASAAYVFVGPVQYEYRPFQFVPPTRLVNVIPYGLSVWRDGSGVWHQKYAPSLEELADATAVYGGGRVWRLTDAQRADLIAAGYGPYITQEVS